MGIDRRERPRFGQAESGGEQVSYGQQLDQAPPASASSSHPLAIQKRLYFHSFTEQTGEMFGAAVTTVNHGAVDG